MRPFVKGLLVGIVATIGLGVLGLLAVVKLGMLPTEADTRPPALEAWLAKNARRAYLARVATQTNPLPADAANLAAGLHHYDDHCSGCHGRGDGVDAPFGQMFYPTAPRIGLRPFKKNDGWIFYQIKHGIRLTGMPAFAQDLKDDEIWQITAFLKNLDKLPPEVNQEWTTRP